jgi:RHS repeat-associated protein
LVRGATTQFTWDGAGQLPLLLQEATSGATTSYIYGPSGLPLEEITPSGTPYWYHHDQLGSTRALSDSSGSVQATYSYDPYGNLTTSSGSVSTPLRFAGEYTDVESGLQYLRARYYDPTAGQFLTRDPLAGLTHSAHAYVGGNPLNMVDPTGLRKHIVPGPKPSNMSDAEYQQFLQYVATMDQIECENARRAEEVAALKATADAEIAALRSRRASLDAWRREADRQEKRPGLISDALSHPRVDPTYVGTCVTGAVGGAASTVAARAAVVGAGALAGPEGVAVILAPGAISGCISASAGRAIIESSG